VRSTFGLREVESQPLGASWDGGWRYGDVVLSPVADHARAAWSAKVRETLVVDGLRLARPVRGTDGRYVVSGWRADTYLEGNPEPRHDEVVAVSLRLHEATANLERPRFLAQPPVAPWVDVDVFVAADRAAWEATPLRSLGPALKSYVTTPDAEQSLDLLRRMASLRKPVTTPPQLVHGDLFGTVLFAGDADPAVVDVTPFWRPGGWAIAVLAVDAVARGGAPIEVVGEWADGSDWPQLMRRAALFRLAASLAHPRTPTDDLVSMLATVERVDRFLR